MARPFHCMKAGAIEQPVKRGSSRLRGQLVGLVISVVCIAFVATKIDFHALGQVLVHFDLPWLAVGLASLAVGYTMRIARWAMMLRAAGATIDTASCAAPFLGSIALNNVLPFRAGDVVRALVFPKRLGLERTTATASLLLERVMDLAALVLCLGIGIALLGTTIELPMKLQRLVVVASIGTSVVLAFMLFASARISALVQATLDRRGARLPALVSRGLHIATIVFNRMAAMSRPHVLLRLSLMSIPVWLGEAGLYFALTHGLHAPLGFAGALTVMALTTLSTLIPSTPGYVGPFHLAAFAAASMLGLDSNSAGAFAILAHFTLWAATTFAGAISILTHRDLFAEGSPANQ